MPDLNFGRFNQEEQENILKDFLAQELALIISTQEEKGLRASGKSASSLRVETKQLVQGEVSRGELIDGSGSFTFQEKGRGPNSSSPKEIVGGLWGKIYTWLAYKKYGLNWKDKKQRINMAWAITKKIQRSGTFTFHQNSPTGVLSIPFSNEKFEALSEKIMTIENVIDIKNTLLKEIF